MRLSAAATAQDLGEWTAKCRKKEKGAFAATWEGNLKPQAPRSAQCRKLRLPDLLLKVCRLTEFIINPMIN